VKAFELGTDNGAPLTRLGNALSLFIPEFTDDQGRYGFQDGRTDAVSARVFENDALIAQGTGAYGDVSVSGAPATYRLELDVTRNAPFWQQSTRTQTAWTFASAPTEAEEAVPLLVVDYDLGKLDLRNRARLGTHTIGLSVHRQQGAPAAAVGDVDVWASYDDGATWVDVPVLPSGVGLFSALAENPARHSGGYVSLRVRATDAGGSVVDQTIIRAYGIR
jgi:hypothetical protein